MQVTSTRRVNVEPGGDQVVSHVGLHALGRFADELGLATALSDAVVPRSARLPLHDRGKVLVQAMLMLAGGGECCGDIEHLRAEASLFDEVPSDSTLYRTVTKDLDPENLAALKEAFASVREDLWRRAKLTKRTDPVVLDIDASLVEVHSEHKEGTGPNYKGGFGFHPMGCFVDCTGEAPAMLLRPGNAGANDAEDHLAVLDEAIAQLTEQIAAGHRDDSLPEEVRRQIVVRTDSAGATYDFVWGCFDRNVGFSVTARTTAQVQAAISYLAADEH
jgi:hypothetical protein